MKAWLLITVVVLVVGAVALAYLVKGQADKEMDLIKRERKLRNRRK